MGFKDLFFETAEEPEERYVPGMQESYTDVETTAPEKDTVDFVGDVYASNNLNDFSRSIFKVEELSNTLPAEMPKDTKRTTVLSIMSTVGLDAESVINDGQMRIHALNDSCDSVLKSLGEDIDAANAEIESLKIKIEELQKECSAKYAQISSIQSVTREEVSRIGKLVDFIMEVPER